MKLSREESAIDKNLYTAAVRSFDGGSVDPEVMLAANGHPSLTELRRRCLLRKIVNSNCNKEGVFSFLTTDLKGEKHVVLREATLQEVVDKWVTSLDLIKLHDDGIKSFHILDQENQNMAELDFPTTGDEESIQYLRRLRFVSDPVTSSTSPNKG